MTQTAAVEKTAAQTKQTSNKKEKASQPKADKKPEQVALADYSRFFEFRKNMATKTASHSDLKGTETFDEIVNEGLATINKGLRKAIIWSAYKNQRGSNLVREIFVESKDVDADLLEDAWQFGITARPDGEMIDFTVVAPDDPKCKYLCAVRKPVSKTLGFYNFKISSGLFPPSSKLDLETCPRKAIVEYGYSRLEQVVVYFLPKQ